MSRLIFWLGLVFLVMFAVRSKLRDLQQRNNPQRRNEPPQRPQSGPAPSPAQGGGYRRAGKPEDVETMLCCAHCGVYYPASENVTAQGRDYCSAAHAGLPAA